MKTHDLQSPKVNIHKIQSTNVKIHYNQSFGLGNKSVLAPEPIPKLDIGFGSQCYRPVLVLSQYGIKFELFHNILYKKELHILNLLVQFSFGSAHIS